MALVRPVCGISWRDNTWHLGWGGDPTPASCQLSTNPVLHPQGSVHFLLFCFRRSLHNHTVGKASLVSRRSRCEGASLPCLGLFLPLYLFITLLSTYSAPLFIGILPPHPTQVQ